MQYSTLIDRILLRARRLGFKNPDTQQVDAIDAERVLLHVLEMLVASHDFDEYTITADETTPIATTEEGTVLYDLPADFGRFIYPTEAQHYGIWCFDGFSRHPLTYQTPDQLMTMRPQENGRPGFFSRAPRRQLRLSPPPDDNNGDNYTIQGVYIEQVVIDELDDFVRFDQPQCLEDMAIGQLAEDWSHENLKVHSAVAERARTVVVHYQWRSRREPLGKQHSGRRYS